MDKFINFWGGIWEKDEKMPVVPWLEEAREAMKAKVHKMEQFTIKEEVLSSTAKIGRPLGLMVSKAIGGKCSNQRKEHQYVHYMMQ